MQDIGIVAKHIFFAKDCPAKPAIINTIGNWFPKIVCAITKTVKLRRASLSSVTITIRAALCGGRVNNKAEKKLFLIIIGEDHNVG